MKQYINGITTPNTHGGSCIDCIISNSDFVKSSGIWNDFISDHHTTFIVKKKDKIKTKYVYRTLRDLSKFERYFS